MSNRIPAQALALLEAAEQQAARRRLAMKRCLRARGIKFPECACYDEAALSALVAGAAARGAAS